MFVHLGGGRWLPLLLGSVGALGPFYLVYLYYALSHLSSYDRYGFAFDASDFIFLLALALSGPVAGTISLWLPMEGGAILFLVGAYGLLVIQSFEMMWLFWTLYMVGGMIGMIRWLWTHKRQTGRWL